MTGDTGPMLCYGCVFRTPDYLEPIVGTGPVTCAQYPQGIPEDIRAGADHRELRGDEAGGRAFAVQDTEYARMMLAAWERRAPEPTPA